MRSSSPAVPIAGGDSAPGSRSLHAVARAVAPPVLARDRRLAVSGALGDLLPGAGLVRGSVVTVGGPVGSGVTSLGLTLAASATAAGEWAAAVDPAGTLGGLAAIEVGVALDRFVCVRHVPCDRWPVVVAALLDGMALVVASVPADLRPGDARRLAARARARGAVLVVLEAWGASGARAAGRWSGGAALRLRAGGPWTGLGRGVGFLNRRDLAPALVDGSRPGRPGSPASIRAVG